MEVLYYKIALTKIPLVGPKIAKMLVSYCGGVENIFKANKKQLLSVPGVGEKIAASILSKTYFDAVEKELIFIEKEKISVHFYLDASYPSRLKHIEDAPLLLYAKGTFELGMERTIAFVGTRTPSKRGELFVNTLIEQLKPYQVGIVSGMAYGIDIHAHKAALKHQLPTVGVLGHGLDRLYPAAHHKTASQMIDSNGGLLSEFSSGTKPDRENFPMRNRIIAGISDAVVIVETKEKGGSMITADIANGYNKEVFAVPGRLNDVTSKGCNYLIKKHRASLIESAEDIVYQMGWDLEATPKTISPQLFLELTPLEQKLVDYLRENGETPIDELLFSIGIRQGEASPILLNLELNGVIRTLPGKKYMLL